MVRQRANLTKLGTVSGQIIRPQRYCHRVKRLIKTFLFGLIFGALGAGALTWYAPAVNLQRERSHISVQTNGGNAEVFRINLPRDRILVGLAGQDNSIPAGLEWPGRDFLGDTQAEMFKIRDRNNVVIGVGSRLASSSEGTGPFIEWAVHLPARGTMYIRMEVTPSADGLRHGILQAGTRDFELLSGSVREQFYSEVAEDQDVQGRIELETALVGPMGDEE